MKKSTYILVVLMFTFVFSKDYTLDQIIDEYPTIFTVRTFNDSNNISASFWTNNDLNKNHFLKKFVRENEYIIGYLLTNAKNSKYTIGIDTLETNEDMNDLFFSILKEDSLFNSYFFDFVARFLLSEKDIIINYQLCDKQSVSFNNALNVMVRFWYVEIDSINNRMSAYICSGINDHNNYLQQERNYFLESLGYSSIMSNKIRLLWLTKFEFLRATEKTTEELKRDNVKLNGIDDFRERIWKKLLERRFVKSSLKKELRRKRKIIPLTIDY